MAQLDLYLICVKCHGLGTFGFFWWGGTGISKKNLTIAGLVYVLNVYIKEKKKVPPYLHLQLDNCAGDNKNEILMGFCGHLAALGIFTRVTVLSMWTLSSWGAGCVVTVSIQGDMGGCLGGL